MSDTPFSVTIQEFGSGKFVLSGDINATASLHGSGYYDLTGDIVGTLTMFGSGYARLIGTISGLFTGAIDATITFFGVGKAIIAGTIGSSALSGTISIFGTGQATLVGSVASSGPPAPTVSSIDVSSGYNSFPIRLYNIIGANFVDGATVKLGATDLTNVIFVDSNTLDATIPAGITAGTYNLVVTNPDLQTGTLINAFTVIQAPSPTVGIRITLDTVTRADNPSDAGSSESPILTWQPLDSSAWAVATDQIYCTLAGATFNYSLLTLPNKMSDNFAIQADVTIEQSPQAGSPGFAFRLSDKDNYLYTTLGKYGDVSIDEVQGGAGNDTTLSQGLAPASPYTSATLRVEVKDGNKVLVFVNGDFICQAISTFNQNATGVGLFGFGISGDRYNNIKVETLIPFTPLALPAMPAWWKADAITGFNDGDSLTSWVDSSGNGNNLGLGGLSTIAPIYHTNVQNGLPGVTFADVPATSLYTTGVTMTNPFSIFVVYSYDGAISGAHRMFHGEGTNWLIGPYNGGYQTFGGGGFAANPPAVVQNAFVYQTVVQIAGNLDNYVNGVYRGSVVPNTAPNNVTVGAYGGETLGGRVLEVIPVNWAADSYLRGLVEGYLVAKLGL